MVMPMDQNSLMAILAEEYQKKQMFNRDSRTPVSNGVGSADSARQKMIERRQNRAKEEK